MQSTSHLLMIKPAAFSFNEQTAESNAFQKSIADHQSVQQQAVKEFDAMVQLLQSNGVNVTVINDTEAPVKPDAIFPNNWVSFHETGDVLLYPMQAENRRLERREDIIRKLEDCFTVKHIIDLSRFEIKHQYLEGTGSMVLDREHKIAYACLSPRTEMAVLNEVCNYLGYKSISFKAIDEKHQPVYHTNVLMCVGQQFAVICLDSIADGAERQIVVDSLTQSGKEIVRISLEQLKHYAGNMLEIANDKGDSLLVMSQQAYEALTEEQKQTLSKYTQPIYSDIKTIETNGGGSARCMIAEVFLPFNS